MSRLAIFPSGLAGICNAVEGEAQASFDDSNMKKRSRSGCIGHLVLEESLRVFSNLYLCPPNRIQLLREQPFFQRRFQYSRIPTPTSPTLIQMRRRYMLVLVIELLRNLLG